MRPLGVAIAMSFAAMVSSAPPDFRTLPNGDQLCWNGTHYDFRAANARQMVKVWVPPGVSPVRGLIVFGHGGGGGDSRDETRNPRFQQFARAYGFGLAGLHNMPGRQVYDQHAETFFRSLEGFAGFGRHPELAHIPIAAYGSSNGGATAYGLVNYAPERAICFVSNVSAWRNPATPVDGALQVPGVFLLGQFDPYTDGDIESERQAFLEARRRGARWAFIVESKGHQDGVAFDLFALLLDRCVALRSPQVASGPLGLVALEHGWFGSLEQADGVSPAIAPAASGSLRPESSSWLIDEEFAWAYAGAATLANPLSLVASVAGREQPTTAMRWIDDGEGLATVRVQQDGPLDLGSLVLRVEGERVAGSGPSWAADALGLGPAPRSCSMVAVTGSGLVSRPLLVIRRSPEGSPAASAGEPWQDTVGARGTQVTGATPNLAANELLAVGLTAEQDREAIESQGIAAFWAGMEPHLALNQRDHARQRSEFSGVHMRDAELRVQAAHTARGLYLLFVATDDEFLEPESDPSQYEQTDSLDVLLDARSSQAINDPANLGLAINPGWGLTLTSKQMQVAFGDAEPPAVVRFLEPDPWDLSFGRVVHLKELQRAKGIEVRFAHLGPFRRAQQWFLPWSALGLPGEPEVGSRLGFAPGYNDRDSGSATKQLRWVDRSSPWACALSEGSGPRGWGDLVIGPGP